MEKKIKTSVSVNAGGRTWITVRVSSGTNALTHKRLGFTGSLRADRALAEKKAVQQFDETFAAEAD